MLANIYDTIYFECQLDTSVSEYFNIKITCSDQQVLVHGYLTTGVSVSPGLAVSKMFENYTNITHKPRYMA